MAREMIVVPYDEAWPELYEKEKKLLKRVFEEHILDIQHFGSTSIKGMSAKPIIDIMIVVEDINIIDNYNEIMIEKGYMPKGENGIEGRRYFYRLASDNSGNHTHHLHIYARGNSHITDELMFRDYLRIDVESFKEYERIKLEASRKYLYSPEEYVDAKHDCVMRIMEKARLYIAGRTMDEF